MKPLISIIIPSFNNPDFLNPCLRSIAQTGRLGDYLEVIVVNNGKQPIKDQMGNFPSIRVLEPGGNLGWEGGLALGLKNSDTPFVCFQNDDTHVPKACDQFYEKLMNPFKGETVSAVGPVSTVVTGIQSTFHPQTPMALQEVSYLIFFCVMIRRKHLEEVGGIDQTLPGGDDFDLSIRLRKAGKKLIVNPEAFCIHHGFKTGNRLRGDHTVSGGWNSTEMIERTNQALIRKHGFKTYLKTVRGELVHA